MSIVSGTVGAVLGSEATSDAARTSAEATTKATDQQVAEARRQYDTARADFEPFREPSDRTMATLQSAIYGGPVAYGGQKTATFQPQESEGFKYTKNRTLEDLGRQLRMMGRGNGTVAANAMGRTLGDLNAANEDKQYGRLIDLVKTGQGAAGSIASTGQNTTNAITGALGQMGQANSLAALQSGMAQANLYGGLGSASANTVGSGIKLYDYGKNAGWWGAGSGMYGSGASSSAVAADAAYPAAEYYAAL